MNFSSTGFGRAIIEDKPKDPNVKVCHCKVLAIKKLVQKETPNKGKSFWCCSLPQAAACKFFEWDTQANTTTAKVAQNVVNMIERQQQQSSSSSTSTSSTTTGSTLLCQCSTPKPAVERESKSEKNNGRWYYSCSNPRESQCKFFQWTDEIGKTKAKPKKQEGEIFTPEGIETFFTNYMVDGGRRNLENYEKKFKQLAEAEGYEVIPSNGLQECMEYKSFWLRKGEYFKDFDQWVFVEPLGGDGQYEVPLNGRHPRLEGWVKGGQTGFIILQAIKGFYWVDRKALWRYIDTCEKPIIDKGDGHQVIKVTISDLENYDKKVDRTKKDFEDNIILTDYWLFERSAEVIMEEPSEPSME